MYLLKVVLEPLLKLMH
jgi:hypothetical protein